ncbi:MAG: hypothetical protein V4687_09705 [Bacteroidota bacterium]
MKFESINLSRLSSVLMFLFFLSPYLGLVPFAYGIMLIGVLLQIQRIKLTLYDYGIFLILGIFFCVKLFQVNFAVWDALVRYYFGVIIVFLFIKVNKANLNIERLISILFWAVLFEAIIINTLINPFQYLPNYPRSVFDFNLTSHYTKFMGFYQRPYSVGMNASTSSTIACGLLMYRATQIQHKIIEPQKKVEIYGLATIILFASGVGLSLCFFYLLYRMQLITFKRVIILFVILAIVISGYDKIIGFFAEDSIFQKVSAAYMEYLFDFKIDQVHDVILVLKDPKNSLWIGQAFNEKSEIIIQSDFAWNDFIQCFGILGPLMYLSFLVNKFNRYNILPILVFLVGAFHYGGVFTLPGQIILAFMLLYLNEISIVIKENEAC